MWEEDGKYPNLIIELLSTSTATTDRTLKKDLYQERFRTPEYFWFSPDTLEFEGFRLVGNRYQQITLNARGWCWSEELGLYLGVQQEQLRYFTSEGDLIPTLEEVASQTQAQLEQERIRSEQLA